MRILHTSDWHLGRSLHQVSLIEAQRAFLDHLVEVVRSEQVDVVVVAGDVYDRAIPPLDAVSLFRQVLTQLADLQIPLIMISGNHDSPRRLGVTADLIERVGIHLRTDMADLARPIILHDSHGPVAFYGLPYLEPNQVGAELQTEANHQAVLTVAMNKVRADLADQPAGTRSVVVAHAFVISAATGKAETSKSERDITAGGVAHVAASVFDGMDYVALGHLHRCQQVSDRIRYSGSPLAYSFSEAGHPKAIWLVDLAADATVTARKILCPVPRPLHELTGRLEDLLTDAAFSAYEGSWLHVTLTDPGRPLMAMDRLRRRFPHTLDISFAPDGSADEGATSYQARVRDRSDHEVTVDFVTHVTHVPATPAEEALLHEGIEAVRTTAAQREAAH
ncbi:exonuclease SbcCD subunit D [Streptacidiphilus fuscans]|uniref:Nuclease SbcCD subunit D n=1 Tax=Streptacidiphilus fuscans TaxID=2789292 RepID=A0A931FIZ7_9ACTN|nr:exonuclease SbcCD subunit D [Streptacidiphilus fuscans]MBF9073910.1 exonuclease SbcCD subunit D [Streptacidiphilus fuscans]